MYLSQITIKNFRKYNSDGITVNFHKGLNALVGENDSGKSTIIDAIKMILQTQSGDYIKIDENDFHINNEGESAVEFSIDCIFEELDTNEAKNFIEWLTFKKDLEGNNTVYTLQLFFRAWNDGRKIYSELKAGNSENGIVLSGKAKELLKCVYLKPLRDAERELKSGRNSRFSQILYNHPLFIDKENNILVERFANANKDIEKFFEEDEGQAILGKIKEILKEFFQHEDSETASIKTSEIRLKAILESLSLLTSEIHPGLGIHNLLFIAAELLLLDKNDDGSLKLALIEELEAHLHPQAQLRLMAYLQKEYNEFGSQLIISTHSPMLASKINVKNIILVKENNAYELIPEKTLLNKGDYLFLQRFLDSSKANFFFAKGIIMVEGDAEALFIPMLADILDLNLEKHGISLVKVGNIGFFRYSRIFLRKDKSVISVPISIITDCDIQPKVEHDNIDERTEETNNKINKIHENYNQDNIRAFVAPHWTFEYSLALSCLKEMLYESILQADKISNSDTYALTIEKINQIENDMEQIEIPNSSDCEFAYKIYQQMILDKKISKDIIAQCLASNLRFSIIKVSGHQSLSKEKMFDLDLYQTQLDENKRNELAQKISNDDYLAYLVKAIKHAAGKE